MTENAPTARSNRSAATASTHAHHPPTCMCPGEVAATLGLPGGLFLSPPRELPNVGTSRILQLVADAMQLKETDKYIMYYMTLPTYMYPM